MNLEPEDRARLMTWLRINECLAKGDLAAAQIVRQQLPKQDHIDLAFNAICKSTRDDIRAAIQRLEKMLRRTRATV